MLGYLENDNFAIISLQVERPRGCDEAVGLIHHILPETSDQSQGVQEVNPGHHGLQLRGGEGGKPTLSTLSIIEICTDHRVTVYTPAHAVAQQMEAGSDIPGCRRTAHRFGCRPRDRLFG